MTRSNPLLKTIHVAAKQLGLDDDARRDLQLQVTGKASLADMTEADMRAVLERMKASGFQVRQGKRAMAPRGDLRLVHKLWSLLAAAGALERPGRAGLNAFIQVRFGPAWGAVPADVDMIRDAKQIAAVIEALRGMCRRAGVKLDGGRR